MDLMKHSVIRRIKCPQNDTAFDGRGWIVYKLASEFRKKIEMTY